MLETVLLLVAAICCWLLAAACYLLLAACCCLLLQLFWMLLFQPCLKLSVTFFCNFLDVFVVFFMHAFCIFVCVATEVLWRLKPVTTRLALAAAPRPSPRRMRSIGRLRWRTGGFACEGRPSLRQLPAPADLAQAAPPAARATDLGPGLQPPCRQRKRVWWRTFEKMPEGSYFCQLVLYP